MACERYLDLIFKKIDKEISDEEDALLSEHMSECESCRTDFLELSRVEHALNNIPEYDVPDTFAGAVTDKLRVNPTGKKKRGYKPYFSLAAACIVLVIVLFYNAFDGSLYDPDKLTKANTADMAVLNEGGNDVVEGTAEDSETDGKPESETYQSEDERTAMLFDVSNDISDRASPYSDGFSQKSSSEGGFNYSSKEDFSGDSNTSKQGLRSDASQESSPQNEGIRQSENTYSGTYNINTPEAENRGSGGALSDSSADNTGIDSEKSQNGLEHNAIMSSAPTDAVLQNSDYFAVATFSVSEKDLDSVLLGLTYSVKDIHVYEMGISDFDILKGRVNTLGLLLDEEAHNSDSETVLVIVTVN